MADLQWSDAPSGAEQKAPPASQIVSAGNNMWFAISMLLIGLIAGYGIAQYTDTGISAAPSPAPVAAGDPFAQPDAPAPVPADVPPVDLSRDHIRGNKNADLAVISYSDYECPFCKRVHPTTKQILESYGDKVMIVFRHFPLSFHANALPSAKAAECANELGGNEAFWEFTDAVMEGTTYDFAAIATSIGLSASDMTNCIARDAYGQRIQDDQDGGSQAGVDGTPGNFILKISTQDSEAVPGAQPFESFKAAIDSLLAS